MGKAIDNKRKLSEYAENLGELASDPTTRLDGSALRAGDTYYKTGTGAQVYDGAAWGALGSGSIAWDDVTGKPSTFTPSSHSHAIADVTGLQTALDAKATGPASSTDNTLPRFDGTTGKLLQGSGVVVDDSDNLGFGRPPSAYSSAWKAIDFNNSVNTAPYASFGQKTTGVCEGFFSWNAYGGSNSGTVGVGYNYRTTGDPASLYTQSTGAHRWFTAPSGTAGNAISFTQAMTLDSSGNLTLSAGAFGYGAGAGGTVTQATSKITNVTLNKPNGVITTHNASLAIGASAYFALNNSFITGFMDKVVITTGAFGARYRVTPQGATSGQVGILIENISGVAQTDAIEIGFAVIKGSTT